MGKSRKIDLSKEKNRDGVIIAKAIVKENKQLQRKSNIKSDVNTAKTQHKKKIKYNATEEGQLSKKAIGVSQQNKQPKKKYFSDNDDKAEEATNTADEETIKDEDIDKYCDDITDEDNKQYEDWVKLIEEKLYDKKK